MYNPDGIQLLSTELESTNSDFALAYVAGNVLLHPEHMGLKACNQPEIPIDFSNLHQKGGRPHGLCAATALQNTSRGIRNHKILVFL